MQMLETFEELLLWSSAVCESCLVVQPLYPSRMTASVVPFAAAILSLCNPHTLACTGSRLGKSINPIPQ
jgi:hypothetical protein